VMHCDQPSAPSIADEEQRENGHTHATAWSDRNSTPSSRTRCGRGQRCALQTMPPSLQGVSLKLEFEVQLEVKMSPSKPSLEVKNMLWMVNGVFVLVIGLKINLKVGIRFVFISYPGLRVFTPSCSNRNTPTLGSSRSPYPFNFRPEVMVQSQLINLQHNQSSQCQRQDIASHERRSGLWYRLKRGRY
jgi:hypothetical protein